MTHHKRIDELRGELIEILLGPKEYSNRYYKVRQEIRQLTGWADVGNVFKDGQLIGKQLAIINLLEHLNARYPPE